MEQSSLVDLAGIRALAVQFTLAGIAVLSIAALFSFGGQLVAAPALLPVQWFLARHTDSWVATSFAVLGGLLTAEVMLIGFVMLVGDGVTTVLLGVVVGSAAGLTFYRSAKG